MTISEQILKHLKAAYPKALSFADIQAKIEPNATRRIGRIGGQDFKRLLKHGFVKQITVGYYIYVG